MKAEETIFRTVVEVPKWVKPMHHNQHFVLLGSCFAQNIGEMFLSYGLHSTCNPLGVVYNPESIAIQIRQALLADVEMPVFQMGQEWRCWWANTLLTDTDETRFRQTLQSTFTNLGESLRNADYLFLTFGSNVCYRLKENGITVANCHKVPGKLFDEIAMDTESCTEILSNLMELLKKECPNLQVVFTVSPYRYKKYGFHGSQLAKSTLLLAVDRICRLYPEQTTYFPAYEIMLDELRDYRFYADDMIHPAPVAVNYIWQRLAENCMSTEMRQHLKEYEPTRKSKMHKAACT